ncbi:MAG TPA: GFA family protein [Polyangiaceae bacterium]|jgi:hypothetical protein|nr:GFA family protein [Polyangiaceae bacterium]
MTMHSGGCHCGAVRFEADLELKDLATCNCSICGKTGAIMAFVPGDKVKLVAGADKLTDYQFGKKSIHHTFCRVCGVRPVANGAGTDGKNWAMVNVRCLDGIDAHELKIDKTYNGKDIPLD